MFDIGDCAYLSKEITEPACGDHPAFLMGAKGEKVKIIDKRTGSRLGYLVEGPTNKGKPWRAGTDDLMYSKPME